MIYDENMTLKEMIKFMEENKENFIKGIGNGDVEIRKEGENARDS